MLGIYFQVERERDKEKEREVWNYLFATEHVESH